MTTTQIPQQQNDVMTAGENDAQQVVQKCEDQNVNDFQQDDVLARMEPEEDDSVVEIKSFEDFGLKQALVRGIYSHGFDIPSAIQQKAILPLVHGKDTIAQAQSGTGKTGAFCIAALQLIDAQSKIPQALIVAPTRELATQIKTVCASIGEKHLQVRCHVCIGGTDQRIDKTALQSGVQLIVGTPGRLVQQLSRSFLDSRSIRLLILDEADEMLSQGFQAQIYNILQSMPKDIQVGLFSATMPPEMLQLTEKFMRDPVRVLIKTDQLTLDGLRQFYINIMEERHKYGVLIDIYENVQVAKAIIYCNTKQKVVELANALGDDDFVCSMMHGQMSSAEREQIMREFRSGTSRILVTTDLLARGIDIQQVSLVINYDMPISNETYIHRIGRSGRYGRKGFAINFCTNDEISRKNDLEKHYNTHIEPLPEDFKRIIAG